VVVVMVAEMIVVEVVLTFAVIVVAVKMPIIGLKRQKCILSLRLMVGFGPRILGIAKKPVNLLPIKRENSIDQVLMPNTFQ
jgi:hypothetical protein